MATAPDSSTSSSTPAASSSTSTAGTSASGTSSTTTPANDDQAAEMQAALDAYNAGKAKAAADARAAKLKPLTDLLASDAWTQFRAQIGDASVAALGETFYDSVRALDVISGNVASMVASSMPSAAASASAPTA